jgi:uncharacterized protein HemX
MAMDLRKATLKRVAVWLVIGLVGGGFAADTLWREKGAQERAALRAQHAQQMERLEAEVKSLTDQLAAERLRREALERELTEGKK